MALPKDRLAQLVQDAKNGNTFAFAQLMQDNYEIVYKFIIKLTLDSQIAADITQECMVRVIRKFPQYDPQRASLSTWMIAIAKNLWIEQCRKNRHEAAYTDSLKACSHDDTIDRIINTDEILLALKKLDKRHRLPIVLFYAQGYHYEEIAKMLAIPLGTVKSRISNGLKLLRKELDGHDRS